MKNDHNHNPDRVVSCSITPAALELIDYYAEVRKLYRSNWLREAISEKLEREFEAEKARSTIVKGIA